MIKPNFNKDSNEEEILSNWRERKRFKAKESPIRINKISYNRQGERTHLSMDSRINNNNKKE